MIWPAAWCRSPPGVSSTGMGSSWRWGSCERGNRVGIFPEGWGAKPDPEIMPLKRGVAFISQHSGCRVLPVALAGTTDLWRGKTLRVRIAPPLDALPPGANRHEEQIYVDGLRAVLQDGGASGAGRATGRKETLAMADASAVKRDRFEVVRAWHEAVNRGDADALVALCDDDIEVGGPRGSARGMRSCATGSTARVFSSSPGAGLPHQPSWSSSRSRPGEDRMARLPTRRSSPLRSPSRMGW